MVVSIQQALKKVLFVVQDVHSILITDKDGVTIVSAGEPVRNVASLTSSYATALDQSSKLNLGTPKYWTFMYESRQLVIFSRPPFVVYILASQKANNTALTSILDGHMQAILDECEIVYRSVMAGISMHQTMIFGASQWLEGKNFQNIADFFLRVPKFPFLHHSLRI